MHCDDVQLGLLDLATGDGWSGASSCRGANLMGTLFTRNFLGEAVQSSTQPRKFMRSQPVLYFHWVFSERSIVGSENEMMNRKDGFELSIMVASLASEFSVHTWALYGFVSSGLCAANICKSPARAS